MMKKLLLTLVGAASLVATVELTSNLTAQVDRPYVHRPLSERHRLIWREAMRYHGILICWDRGDGVFVFERNGKTCKVFTDACVASLKRRNLDPKEVIECARLQN